MNSRFSCTGALAISFFLAASASAQSDIEAQIQSFENGLRPAVIVDGKPEVRWTIKERMTHYRVPGVSIAVIRRGKLAWARAYGVKQTGSYERVDTETVFSVGSLSKVPAAVTALRLVQEGKLDLDRNVNEYLGRWQVPDSGFTAIWPVTLRGIMSHTSGLTVHGFPDFQAGDQLPSVIDTLDGRPPAKTEPVRVVYVPGTGFHYSGGGTTVEQLVIEEVTGLDFATAAEEYVFKPLGMERSTYRNPLPASHGNAARAHGSNGELDGWEIMPEMAASGLWTTPRDYARLVIALIDSYKGRKAGFLEHSVAVQMMTEVGPSSYGLGPRLNGRGFERRFSHRGSNDSYKAWMEGNLATGHGAVIFTNGAGGSDLRFELRRAVAEAEGWPLQLTVNVPQVDIVPETLNEYVGLYEVKPAGTLPELRLEEPVPAYRLQHADGKLYLHRAGSDRRDLLIPESHSQFISAHDAATRIEFVRGYSGNVERLIIRAGNHFREANKVSALR